MTAVKTIGAALSLLAFVLLPAGGALAAQASWSGATFGSPRAGGTGSFSASPTG